MQFKKLIFIFFLSIFWAFQVSAVDCDLIKHLSDAKVRDHGKFWEDYSALGGNLSDRQLLELLQKHNLEPKNNSKDQIKKVTLREPMNQVLARRAEKDLSILPQNLRKQFEEFMTIMSDKSGMKTLYENPGRWHMEKIKAIKDAHSVRLNGGVRVLFKIENNEITILEVNAAKIHSL